MQVLVPESTVYTKGMCLRLAEKTGWSEEKMKIVISEYLRYIALIMLWKQGKIAIQATPSHDIDEVWHNHMLFTREYIQFCEKWNGEYIHHQPSYNADGSRPGGWNAHMTREENKAVLQKAWAETREAYNNVFGENAPDTAWGTVGECCSGCICRSGVAG